MTHERWYISDNTGEDCSTLFFDLEKARFWKDYLTRANPKRGPYQIYGVLVDEFGKIAVP